MCQPECMERLRRRRGTRRSGGSWTGQEQENEEQKRQETVRLQEKTSGKDILPVKIMTKRTFFLKGLQTAPRERRLFCFCGMPAAQPGGSRAEIGCMSGFSAGIPENNENTCSGSVSVL